MSRETSGLGLLLFLLLLISCSKEPVPPEESPGPPVAESMQGATTVAVAEEPDQLVPPLSRTVSSSAIWPLILPSLVRVELDSQGNGRFVGDLAIDWSIDEGGKSARFLLDRARKWVDTTSVDEDDVIESYRLYREPRLAGEWSRQLEEITEMRAIVEDQSVQFRFRRPLARATILQLASLPVVSADELRREMGHDSRLEKPDRLILCAGPFQVTEWRRGAFMRLSRHPFPPRDRVPWSEEILLRFIPSGRSRALQFEQGTVTLATDLPLDEALRLREGAKGEGIRRVGQGRVETLVFNLNDPLWARRIHRIAVASGLDRDRLQETLSGGWEDLVDPSPRGFPLSIPHFDSLLESTDEVIPSLELLYAAADLQQERLGVEIALQLGERKIAVQLIPCSTADCLARVQEGRFQAVLLGWSPPLLEDVGELYRSDGVFNFAGLADSILDARIELARSAAADSNPGLWGRVVARVEEQIPLIYLGRSVRIDGIDPRITGYGTGRQAGLWFQR